VSYKWESVHAIRQYELGPPETLRYEEVADPVPGEGQVRIAVEAAGVHLIDTVIRRGDGGRYMPVPDLPMTPGREVAGGVDALGPGVGEEWLGRRVVAHLGFVSGGYAQRAVADVSALHEIPEPLSAAAAVAMIGTGRTAVGILDIAALSAEERELEGRALAEAAAAHAAVESRAAIGKTVLVPEAA
jgi:NADPH2:quinone reductase